LREGACEGGIATGIPTATLDGIVLERLSDHLLTAERVQAIVAEVTAKRAAGNDDAVMSIGLLRAQRAKTNQKLANLINALADGVVEASETFKATVKNTEADCQRLATMIATQERILDTRLEAISLAEAEVYAAKIRRELADSAPSLKKRIIRSFVGAVVVTADEIIITGAKSDLAEVVTGSR
jgi:hypothetical protein